MFEIYKILCPDIAIYGPLALISQGWVFCRDIVLYAISTPLSQMLPRAVPHERGRGVGQGGHDGVFGLFPYVHHYGPGRGRGW